MVTPLLLLVLDDYHLLGAQPVHALQTFLLVHSPPQLRFAVATRADPPWPVARLRARDQVTEIRERDLRFTARSPKSVTWAYRCCLYIGSALALIDSSFGVSFEEILNQDSVPNIKATICSVFSSNLACSSSSLRSANARFFSSPRCIRSSQSFCNCCSPVPCGRAS